MNIEVKNIKFGPAALSRETLNFAGDLYIDGKKAALVYNDGNGGDTMVEPREPYENNRKLIRAAEEWAKTLPPEKSEVGDLDMTLDFYVDIQVNKVWDEKEEAKFMKKMTKACINNIVIYSEEKDGYRKAGWKGWTIDQMLKDPKACKGLKGYLTKLCSQLEGDEIIYNANLQPLLAEIKKEQNGNK